MVYYTATSQALNACVLCHKENQAGGMHKTVTFGGGQGTFTRKHGGVGDAEIVQGACSKMHGATEGKFFFKGARCTGDA